ncbi:hypothetical protein AB7102_14570 [Providencia manganoxydans]|uniref:hypothetical protein n=1 Tax=Providencia manganoxydans TaxID=2923283 RepID=UPI0034E3B174
MKVILLIIKIGITAFLAIFFAAGLTTLSSAKSTGSVIFLLVVTGMLIAGLSYWWFFPKKKRAGSKEVPIRKVSEIEKQAAKEFSERTVATQLNDDIPLPKTVTFVEDHEELIKTYVMENGKSLIWQGTTKPASFRVRGESNKLHGIFTRLSIHDDGEFYLELTDPATGEATNIAEKEIITAITVGASRYDFRDLCKKNFKLDLHELFEYAKDVRYAAKEINVIAEFPAIPTTFTYLSSSGKTKRTVDINQYKKNGYGDEYVAGYCHVRNEHRTFAVGKIQTMMASDGHKKYYFHDWLKNVAGITNHDS